jgi:pyruvate dehydrogenase E2 component (dihydrolipoamide acetyltransferase)
VSSSHSEGAPFVEHDTIPPMDAVELTVPDLGPGHDTATIVAWAKDAGDFVARDEAICRLAVDDLQFDVHATVAGELRRVFVEAGGSVRGRDSLAEVAPRAAQDAPPYDAEPAVPDPEPEPTAVEPVAGPERVRDERFYTTEPQQPGADDDVERIELSPEPESEPVDLEAEPEPEPIEIVPDPMAIVELAPPREESEPQPAPRALDPEPQRVPASDPEPKPAPPAEDPWPSGDDVDWARWHSPVVRMLAAEHGVDLSQVEGTGAGGRIRKRDVLAYVEDSAHS